MPSPAVPLLRVGPPGGPLPDLALAPALAWFAARSAGRFTPRERPLADVTLPALARFRGLGGLERHPHGSQALVAAALADLADPGDGPLVVAVPPGFRPHCWHLAGDRRRRYALLPADAPLGAVAHELGHLLLGWPDLERDTGLGAECLMARGGLLPDPAPPCAVLRLRAGWIAARTPGRATRVDELAIGDAAVIGERVIERRAAPDRLLILLDRPRPLLLRRVALTPDDLARPLLAVARFGT